MVYDLDTYTNAMVIDSETGKPMMKVKVSGGAGGGDAPEVIFPSSFPDPKTLAEVKKLITSTNKVEASNQKILTEQKAIRAALEKPLKVEVQEPEPDPEPDPEPEE